jgi:RHS repeat-associated protein
VLELLDASGNAFAAYRYDAWGLPQGAGNYATGIWTQSTSLITSTLAGQIASRQVLRYAGYAYDAETGLYYCSARYFDPVTRQFTTADSAKADGEQSSFQYCSGDPVGNVDPTGEYGANQNHHGIGRTMSQKGVASAWQFEGTGMWTVLGWCQRLGDATGSPSGGPAWCADAVSYMYGSDGYKGRPKSQAYSYAFRSKVGSYSYGGPGFASCLKLHEAAVNHFRGLSWIKFSNRSSVVNGDIIIYNWGTRGTYKHTGIVVNKKSRETIEGNRGAYHSVGHIEHGFDKPDVWDHQVEGFIHVSE